METIQQPQITLRPYQANATLQIREHFAKGIRKVILCLPTGGGKTVCFSDMISQTLQRHLTKKTLILTHRAELLTQAGSTLGRFGIYPACLTSETKGKDINFSSRVLVAMAETYDRRLKKYPQLADYDLVIIDEAHIGNFKKIFKQWELMGKDLFVVGATATPISAKKRDPLNNYYKGIVAPVSIDELIEIGSLVPAKTFSAVFNRSKLISDTSNEDGFDERSQMLEFDRREVYAGLIDKYKAHCLTAAGEPKKTVCFNVNVAHSKQVTQSFIEAGYRARHIDGYMLKEERVAILKAFDRGEFDILCNTNIVTAGYDNPAIEVVIINKATKSLSVWLQACGRGSRPYPGKEFFVILDMAQNWSELRLWQATHDWEGIFWNKPKLKKPGAAPVKACKKCGYLNPVSAKICGECFEPFPVKENGEPLNPEFVEIDNGYLQGMTEERRAYILELWSNTKRFDTYSVPDLIDIATVKGFNVPWIIRQIRQRSPDIASFAVEIQELADYKKYWQTWVTKIINEYRA